MSTALRTYYRGPSLVTMRDEQAGTSSVYHFDCQGTTQALTSQAGAVTDRFASDAWGVQVKRTGTSINRHWFIGKRGFYRSPGPQVDYLGSDYLQPTLGRLLGGSVAGVAIARSPYAFQRNAATLAVAIVPPIPKDPFKWHVHLIPPPYQRGSRQRPPTALNDCGGAGWRVEWDIRNRRGETPFDAVEQACGWVVQHVEISSQVFDCVTGQQLSNEQAGIPQKGDYYEAWWFRYVPPASFSAPATDDTFAYSGSPGRTRGTWTIKGDAMFFPFESCNDPVGLPPWKGWQPKEPCNQLYPRWNIGLPCSVIKPPDFDRALYHVKRCFTVEWGCGCDGCILQRCAATLQQGIFSGYIAPPIAHYKCANGPDPVRGQPAGCP
jgi:hypothetical protein